MTENDFIDAILAAEENAAPRLAYADWLEERGDARGEYLRLLASLDGAASDSAARTLARLQQVQLEGGVRRRWVTLMCRGRITRVLRDFQEGEPRQGWPPGEEYRRLARRHDALPVYADMGGVILLRPDGEWLTLGDDDDEPRTETDRGWRMIGLVYAAEFFPELRPLLPPRPADAGPCPGCGGRGLERWRLEGVSGITPCGGCFGLGWLPRRPDGAGSCPACGGTGRPARPLPHGTFTVWCGTCGGRGWLSEDQV
jgi:uncharacterized protein (TIGR02996 family)